MTNEFLLGLVRGYSALLEFPPELTLWMIVALISLGMGISLARAMNKNTWAGVMGFFGTLTGFAMIDAFPWIFIAMGIIIVMVTHYYQNSRGG